MVPFIATVSEGTSSDIRFIEEYQVIVMAENQFNAERSIQKFISATKQGAAYAFRFDKAWASPDYLKAAKLKPGEVRRYNP
jgi:hypothetical protein